MWLVEALEIANEEGKGTGKFRMVATSDAGGGQHGNPECYHDSAAEACLCDACDEFTSGYTGFPSRKRADELKEARDRREYARLYEKYEGKPPA